MKAYIAYDINNKQIGTALGKSKDEAIKYFDALGLKYAKIKEMRGGPS